MHNPSDVRLKTTMRYVIIFCFFFCFGVLFSLHQNTLVYTKWTILTRHPKQNEMMIKKWHFYQTFSFSQCSASCGKGFRYRNVECRFRNGQISLGCNESNKPATADECNVRPCPTWLTRPWGRVSCLSNINLTWNLKRNAKQCSLFRCHLNRNDKR